ncbi:hypothetical protein CKO28_22330 [Rhodovibrio sodomensis]|uniref:Protein YebE n=1 Tax=Rhodovibrio sodomensis TaxID=1088 RepID=A0ABS1DM04_9PROT|nr:tellurite resistance TerB family protein [Rhodovibrio sodomensis]MBK1670759.1 hypothetical protein [Rhodovibrio sodomensis]
MLDANGFLGRLLQDPGAKGALGGVAGGALTGLLMNKKARKTLGETAVNVGGVAALAGVAYLAYQKYQGRQDAPAPVAAPDQPGAGSLTPPPAGSSFLPKLGDTAACNALALKLVRAMIAAASADGQIDGAELKRVLATIEQADLSPSDKAAMLQAMNTPDTLDGIAALADSREVATELYAASLSAIEVDSPAEHAYLSMLATKLNLPGELVGAIHEVASGADMPPPGAQQAPRGLSA